MKNVVSALIAAFRSLFSPKMLVLVVWPMLLAVILWMGVAWYFWSSWVASLTGVVQATPLEQWVAQGFLAIVSHYLISIILVALLLPVIYITALVITAIFAMPLMTDHVANRNYPELERKNGGNTVGSIANTLVAIILYCIGWVLSLPLWLLTPLAVILPVILVAYLNQRLFRYDALAEHASGEEYEQIIEQATGKLYLLGVAIGLLHFVPVLNLFLPVYAGLAFIHLCLAELKLLRESKIACAG
ncbi:MAG: EI24 domain-containing protein [Gallionellaceae bacterium]|nr:EI24 domain-containing protein [Gallionellaceae bacterium]